MPPRKRRLNENRSIYEDGESVSEFYPAGGRFLGRQVVPADNKRKNGSRSFMAPVSHIHLLQDELFRVASGEGDWYLRGEAAPRRLRAGDEIVIPRYKPHRFENAPGSTEPLVIEYNYATSMREMELRFFCNVFAYMDDCYQAGLDPSICQLCVFCTDAWMPIDLGLPGPEVINLIVGTLFLWVLAAIGYFVLGYKPTYDEYYQEGGIEKKLRSP